MAPGREDQRTRRAEAARCRQSGRQRRLEQPALAGIAAVRMGTALHGMAAMAAPRAHCGRSARHGCQGCACSVE